MTLTDRLRALVRESPVLMEALRAVREPAMPRDIDVGYFDPGDLTPARDNAVAAQLRERAPHLPWDAKNQAAVHLWYPQRFGIAVPPFRNTAEAIATFPETASCVGLRLHGDDRIDVVAPHGLEDLFGLVCRRNPTRVSIEFYERRVSEKAWADRWPDLRIVSEPPSSSVKPQRR